MNIEVLYFEGCPNHLPAIEMVRETLKSLGREDEIRQIEVRTQADAEAVAFVGSPSIRVNGADIEPWARTAKAFGLSCRTYLDGSHRSGVPSRKLLRRAISEGIADAPASIASEPNASPAGTVSNRQSAPISPTNRGSFDGTGSKALFAGGISAILASTCCLGPLILISLGFSGAWIGNLTVLEPYRPFFIVASVVALFFAGRQIFRPARLCNPGEVCALPRARRIYKFLFSICAVLLLVAVAYPYVAHFFY
jgi:mercuric ion transport protein